MLDIVNMYNSNIPGKLLSIKSDLLKLIFIFYSKELLIPSNQSDYKYDKYQLQYIKSTLSYIEEHFSENITIDILAKMLD